MVNWCISIVDTMIDIDRTLQEIYSEGRMNNHAYLLLRECIYEKRTVWEGFESDFRALVQKVWKVSMKSTMKAGHSIEIRDIMNIIKKEFPILLKMDIFNPDILKKVVIEELNNNDRYRTMLSLKDINDSQVQDMHVEIFQYLQKKDTQLQALFKLIPEVFNDLGKINLYKILVESALGHISYEIRRETLYILFGRDLNKINYNQFNLILLFDYLPDEAYYAEIMRKNFGDSILDPSDFLQKVGMVLQHLGNQLQQERFKTWLVALSNSLSVKLSDLDWFKQISLADCILGYDKKFWNQI